MTRRLALLVGLTLLGLAAAAEARPGGGHSYSGGSSHSSSSHSSSSRSSSSRSSYSPSRSSSRSSSYSAGGAYSGSSGDPVGVVVGVLIVAGLTIPGLILQQLREPRSDFDTAPTPTFSPPPPPRNKRIYAHLRRRDPDFSAVLFEDFVYALYARVHAARHDPAAMAALAPYVSEDSREALLRRDPRGVKIHGVVIGRMDVNAADLGDPHVTLSIEFESNYTAELPGGPQGYYVRERWTLERAAAARSRPPETVLSFHCPACGAPYVRSDAGACAHCGQTVEDGRFEWRLRFVRLHVQEPRPPALTGDVAEQGTGLPTVFDTNVAAEHAALVAEDPEATAVHLEKRLHDIYHALNTAWTARDLRTIRPHVSDALFNYLTYWIEAYRAQGLRNVLEEMEISRMQVVKLTRDRHFDAITVRFWASGRDYTVDADGRRVSGSHKNKRTYSEYWTLIRGAAVRGAPRDPERCPNCGAALDRVNMAGTCEYCSAHLTRGEFDWVLSKIEQDEAYLG